MNKNTMEAPPAKRTTKLERTFKASLQDVWDLWTTKEGIESWWGPEGFSVEVRKIDVRPGGELVYAMVATGAQQIEFMKQAGMPLSVETRITYSEVAAPKRLAYLNLADFIPGVTPYETKTSIDLVESPESVRMIVTLEAMHSDEWTQRMVMGMESQLGKLTNLLAGR